MAGDGEGWAVDRQSIKLLNDFTYALNRNFTWDLSYEL